MKIILPENDGYTLEFEIEKYDIYCPNCGKKKCYFNESDYDYEAGQPYIFCTSCCHGDWGIDFDPVDEKYKGIIGVILNSSIQPEHNPRPPKKFEDMTDMEQAFYLMNERMINDLIKHHNIFEKFMKGRLGKGKKITFKKYSELPKSEEK